MKKTALLVCLLALLLCGAARPKDTEAADTLIVATDLHYLAPALTDHGPLFTSLTESSDGKLMRYIEELTDAFLSEVIAQRPAALLLTGDLTFNGALLSHTALAEKLRDLEKNGVPVYILPGNHDLNNPGAAAFSGNEYRLVPSAGAEDFRRIYADFGFDEALSTDTDSLSYVIQLSETTRLLMLDFNTLHDPCGISDMTLGWVGEQLAEAQRAGQRVLAAGHQNLLRQTVFTTGYVVSGATRLADLFRQYGGSLFLSGHLHCQHWKSEQGITEIATGALSVSPCPYAVLTLGEKEIRYETRETDVAARALKQGWTDPALLDFPQYARDYFDARNRQQNGELLPLLGYTPEEVTRMTEYLVLLNRAYFSGDLREAASWDPDGEIYRLFGRFPALYTAYLDSARPDFGRDFRRWESGTQPRRPPSGSGSCNSTPSSRPIPAPADCMRSWASSSSARSPAAFA